MNQPSSLKFVHAKPPHAPNSSAAHANTIDASSGRTGKRFSAPVDKAPSRLACRRHAIGRLPEGSA